MYRFSRPNLAMPSALASFLSQQPGVTHVRLSRMSESVIVSMRSGRLGYRGGGYPDQSL